MEDQELSMHSGDLFGDLLQRPARARGIGLQGPYLKILERLRESVRSGECEPALRNVHGSNLTSPGIDLGEESSVK